MPKYIYSVAAGCCFCQECQYVCPVSAITMDAAGAHIDSANASAAANAPTIVPLKQSCAWKRNTYSYTQKENDDDRLQRR